MARAPLVETVSAPFTGFGPGALPFLEGLAANQTRDWFLEHRPMFERDLRGPLGALVEALAFAFAAHDIPLTGTAKGSLFRMNRDIRFSKDKRPYKTNAGATMTRDGVKMSNGLLYIQVGGEDGSMMAAGFYAAEPKDLATLRQAIAADPEHWLGLESRLADAGLALSMGEGLTRMPRGFEHLASSPAANALKLRHLVVSRPITPERLADTALVDDIAGFTAEALPLLRFGWRALDRARAQA